MEYLEEKFNEGEEIVKVRVQSTPEEISVSLIHGIR